MEPISPIALFVYNRPEHTRKVLESLKKNYLAQKSILYIYADGPKLEADKEEMKMIEQVREVIRLDQWCKKVYIKESDHNLGLAKSIINGVTEIANIHGSVIVLEDDIQTSQGFLKFMNSALSEYKDEEKVMHVSGYMFPVKKPEELPATFFYNTASCWGWGTWKNAWDHLITDSEYLLQEIQKRKLVRYFNINDSISFTSQLERNISLEIDTWAVKWYASMVLSGGYSLHPRYSLTRNIGHDGSGVNCSNSPEYMTQGLTEEIQVVKGDVEESKLARRKMEEYYNKLKRVPFSEALKTKLKAIIRRGVK